MRGEGDAVLHLAIDGRVGALAVDLGYQTVFFLSYGFRVALATET